ncbi:hypothetical protein BCR34DRAFT_598051 [Clohesyomyces aquaticus]|uniref:Secreted protein n=1 Tax=Clohesyomyces aquaticus TaxID=1231657 RepID=A0A1Y2A0I6_9PLEO|nr:hypothetical protein BCR34DRAFT_598051 [Clohesyomyces aquaticus]
MRSSLVIAAAAPALVAAICPDPVPQISSLQWSGTGCPSSSAGAVKSYGPMDFSEVKAFTFNQLDSDNTEACEIHLQAKTPAGWQVAIKEVAHTGDVTLKPNSELDWYTQIYWSKNAADTAIAKGSIVNSGGDTYRNGDVTVRSKVTEKWSDCSNGNDGVGILNVNFRPVINGDSGHFNFRMTTWYLDWRRC